MLECDCASPYRHPARSADREPAAVIYLIAAGARIQSKERAIALVPHADIETRAITQVAGERKFRVTSRKRYERLATRNSIAIRLNRYRIGSIGSSEESVIILPQASAGRLIRSAIDEPRIGRGARQVIA